MLVAKDRTRNKELENDHNESRIIPLKEENVHSLKDFIN